MKKAKMSAFKLLSAWMALILMFSCGGGDTEELNSGLIHVDAEGPSNELEIILVPTPMQVPTVLIESHCNYHTDHILADLLNDRPATSYQKSIQLGISIVDFSYAAVNQDQSLSSSKLKECITLMDELGIDIPKDEEFLDRIERNKGNVDSLSFLILTAFERSTDYFKTSDKEELGISILVGTALESSLLLAQELTPERNSTYFSFFNQQKDYASGLQVIMRRYKDEPAMQVNLKIAKDLEKAFIGFENRSSNGEAIRFEARKADLLSDIILIKERSLH
jgi:hypothetical protein